MKFTVETVSLQAAVQEAAWPLASLNVAADVTGATAATWLTMSSLNTQRLLWTFSSKKIIFFFELTDTWQWENSKRCHLFHPLNAVIFLFVTLTVVQLFSLRGASGPSNRAMNYAQIRCVVNECCAEGGLIRRHEWLWKERQGQSEEEKRLGRRGMCVSGRPQGAAQVSTFTFCGGLEILIN